MKFVKLTKEQISALDRFATRTNAEFMTIQQSVLQNGNTVVFAARRMPDESINLAWFSPQTLNKAQPSVMSVNDVMRFF